MFEEEREFYSKKKHQNIIINSNKQGYLFGEREREEEYSWKTNPIRFDLTI